MKTHVIFYVADQARSASFYAAVLRTEPTLHVPGMTEFPLSSDAVLGLMPEEGIRRLLARQHEGSGIGDRGFRAELYLVVDDPYAYHARALSAGAEELSPVRPRDWGDVAGYSRDFDGYILAFARSG